MNILEIIEPTISSVRSKKEYKPEYGTGYKNDPDFIDSGSFSIVKKDKDPHMISKVARGSEETNADGYWIFANYVIKYKLWENPYFPRLYKKKTTVYSNEQKINQLTMEKLFPIKSLNQKEGKFLYLKMFGESINKFSVDYFTERLEREVESAKFEGDRSKYDKKYIHAVNVLNKIHKKEQLIVDIWGDNVMIRRGPQGVQAVFSDPFSFKL